MFKFETIRKHISGNYFILLFILILMFIVSGCSKSSENGNTNNTNNNGNGNTSSSAVGKIGDYYPFSKDTIFHYKGAGNEFAQKDVSVDFIKGDRMQLRTNNGGTETIDVIENRNGELKRIYTRGECYFREDFTVMAGQNAEILLKEPLVKGTSWTLSDGSERYISAVNKQIETPLEIYSAIEVTTKSTKGDITHDYYAKDVGLVKSEFISGSDTISSTLEQIEDDVATTQTMKFYHPYFSKDKVAYIEQDVELHTNDLILPILEKHMKEKPNSDLSADLTKNVKINKLAVDSVKNQVDIDFSSNFVTDMNAGSGFEGMVLQSIANTLGDYYDTDKVYITLDGKPYSSGHFAMGKDEPFTVDYSNSIKYQK